MGLPQLDRSGDAERVRIIETDCLTGAERELPNYDDKGRGTWTLEDAERSIAWRRANITSRYDYHTVVAALDEQEGRP